MHTDKAITIPLTAKTFDKMLEVIKGHKDKLIDDLDFVIH